MVSAGTRKMSTTVVKSLESLRPPTCAMYSCARKAPRGALGANATQFNCSPRRCALAGTMLGSGSVEQQQQHVVLQPVPQPARLRLACGSRQRDPHLPRLAALLALCRNPLHGRVALEGLHESFWWLGREGHRDGGEVAVPDRVADEFEGAIGTELPGFCLPRWIGYLRGSQRRKCCRQPGCHQRQE